MVGLERTQPMNPLADFPTLSLIAVFFVYGLAFFAMGLALIISGQRASRLRFVDAIRPLAAFGILHGIHEWVEMFQKIASLAGERTPPLAEEAVRLAILVASFLMLMAFAVQLLLPERASRRRSYMVVGGAAALWLLCTAAAVIVYQPSSAGIIPLADVLARYTLAIPGALLGAWALMTQQRTFRELGMERFGQDLVWCATALCLYGAVGQVFVRPTPLPPSTIINSILFLQWFGFPVQLFRGLMATILAIYMARALNVFEVENRRRLEEALEGERQITDDVERLNEELRLRTRDLSLLLDLSNLVALPMALEDGLRTVMQKSVQNLTFPRAGLISLVRKKDQSVYLAAAVGFDYAGKDSLVTQAVELGEQSVVSGLVCCRHLDGIVYEFSPQDATRHDECRGHPPCEDRGLPPAPATMISFPLIVRQEIIGSIAFSWATSGDHSLLPSDEYGLMLGIAQQMALSIENARLRQQAQEREKMLGELLHQVVGVQETERQRIARELHDVTGQSLTAIALGLRGVETTVTTNPGLAVEQVTKLKSFSTSALSELRQLIADLRPSQLDDLGLVATLQWYLQEFEVRCAVKTCFSFSGNRAQRLSSEHETTLFRITQEALTNIARHAGASLASVRLDITPAQVCLTIEDNGAGFDVAQILPETRIRGTHGWGLLGMQERASLLGGRCDIEAQSGHGTRIRIRVPIDNPLAKIGDYRQAYHEPDRPPQSAPVV